MKINEIVRGILPSPTCLSFAHSVTLPPAPLTCFCAEALERVTDDALEVFDRASGAADRAAQRKREELRRHHSRDKQKTVGRFIDLARMALEAHGGHTDLPRLIDRRIGLERLREAIDCPAGGLARDRPAWLCELTVPRGGR